MQSALQSGVSGPAGVAGGQAGKTFGNNFKKVAVGVMTLVAAKKFTDFLGGAIGEATEAIKVERQTQAVIKSTGGIAGVTAGSVDTLANKLSKMAGIDDELIAKGSNVLLTFTNVRNEAGKGNKVFDQATRLALDMSVAMGTDLQGSILQVGKALQDPVQGVGALQRVGVRLTDQQKDQVKWMVASGDTLGAQKIILAELGKEFGGSAAAQATAGEKLKVAYGNLKEVIGTALLPIISKIVSVVQPVVEWLGKNKTVALVLAGVIGGVLLVALAAYTISMFTAAAATIAATWPILAIIAAVALVVAGIALLASNWGAVWDWIKQAASDAWNFLNTDVFQPIIGAVSWLAPVFQVAFDGIKTLFHSLGIVLRTIYTNVIQPVWETFKGIVNTVGGAILKVIGYIEDAANALKELNNFGKGDLPFGLPNPLGGLQPRAAGGWLQGWGLVGEEGPEIVNFGRGGAHVFSNAQSQRIATGFRPSDGKAMQMRNFNPTVIVYGDEHLRQQVHAALDEYDAAVDMDLAANGM